MYATKHGSASNWVTIWQPVVLGSLCGRRPQRCRNIWTQTHVDSALEAFNIIQVPLSARDQEIQTLATDAAHKPFTSCIGKGCQLQVIVTLTIDLSRSSTLFIRCEVIRFTCRIISGYFSCSSAPTRK